MGQPFIGASGDLLKGVLASVGIAPDSVYYTNLSKYRPSASNISLLFDRDGMPQDLLLDELASLAGEIARVNPTIIVPLGSYALKFLTGKGKWHKPTKTKPGGYTGIDDHRGTIIAGNGLTGRRKCVPVYHPSAVLRSYSLKAILQMDLRRVVSQAKFAEIRPVEKCIVVAPTGPERQLWIEWLKSPAGTPAPCVRQYLSDAFMSADIEYIGSRLLCLGATRHADVAVVLDTPGTTQVEECRDLLLCGIPLCFQNAMFDCSILEWFYDIPCVQHLRHDTMIAMHAAYTEMPKDLGFIGTMFTELPVWWDKINWEKIKSGEQPITDVLRYNGDDVWVTHSAMTQMLADELTEPAVLVTYEHEMALIGPLWEMSKRGVRVDTAQLGSLRNTLEATILDGTDVLNALNGKVLNVKSGPQVATFIYEKLGVPKKGPKTPTGTWKMDDTTLALLLLLCATKVQREGIKLIRKVRESRDLISKFCEIELDDDGRMRCHYDPAKTTTGRLSSRKFYPTGHGANLQNIPKDTRIRRLFIADPGMAFGYADLKSAESFIVAHKTGDLEMLRLHSDEYMTGGKDGHKFVASFLLGKPIEEITSDDRYLGKRVRHAGNYGMSWMKLMNLINTDAQKTGVAVSAAQAKQLIGRYRQLHFGLQRWWDSVMQQLRATHTLYTCHGRKRVFYDRPDNTLLEAIAYDPQGTIAQTLNMGLLNAAADPALNYLGFQMLMQVHDAIAFQAPISVMNEVCRRLRKVMDVPVPITRTGVEPYIIHIPVEIQTGANWGEADDENPNGLKSWRDKPSSSV
jgi:DNA polymerase-1